MTILYKRESVELKIPIKGLVLLDFWAPWNNLSSVECMLIADLAECYAGKVRIIGVDIDEHPVAAAKYNVRTVPTLLLLEEGRVIEIFGGLAHRRKVRKSIEQAIDRQNKMEAEKFDMGYANDRVKQ